MKIETLEKKIADRANEQVQNAIVVFRRGVGEAIQKLLKSTHSHVAIGQYLAPDSIERKVVSQILADDPRSGWPRELWTIYENSTRNEILQQMDAVQRMLLSREPSADDCKPIAEGQKS